MSRTQADGAGDLVLAGRIAGCFGIRGYLKLEMHAGDPERARRLGRVYVGPDAGSVEALEVADVKLEGGRVLILLEGVPDRTAAERFRGRQLFVAASEMAPPPEGGYYVHEIVGCEVRSAEGALLGVVEDVLAVSGQDLWAVRGGRGLFHVPAVRPFIRTVDTAARTIVVDLPEGLIG